MIISGNTIQASNDVAVFAVRDGSGSTAPTAIEIVDSKNNVLNNSVLLTLARDYVAGGGAGPTMRFRVQGVFYIVDFTRLAAGTQ